MNGVRSAAVGAWQRTNLPQLLVAQQDAELPPPVAAGEARLAGLDDGEGTPAAAPVLLTGYTRSSPTLPHAVLVTRAWVSGMLGTALCGARVDVHEQPADALTTGCRRCARKAPRPPAG